ncbi:sigma factor [Cytophagaceae bacterium YF14B1]|uniref:Sigma factor n=1 Tax=Xanthocytophaga flava TaxID=3048013 RepID=A0AAE3QUZ4_9BACT|nr:sigma factor [Xanthocytophaga flavus]MDJ1483760.1 sigma factor [Xanthocytophaga flavus]
MQDTEIIAAIKERDNAAFKIVYTFYYPMVEHFVKKNSGTSDDARDVFQEAILVLLDKIPKEEFELTSSLKTYIFSISSNIWLKRLREAHRTASSLTTPLSDDYLSELEQQEDSYIQANLIKRIFMRITKPCIKMLSSIFLSELKREILMRQLGYKNTHSFDNQKYKCLQQARKYSKENSL